MCTKLSDCKNFMKKYKNIASAVKQYIDLEKGWSRHTQPPRHPVSIPCKDCTGGL